MTQQTETHDTRETFARLETLAEHQAHVLDETSRLLATLVRLQSDSQAEAIVELHRSGIGVSRVAELLGTTSNTANQAVQRAKRKKGT